MRQELDRIDPHDALAYISLGSTLFNFCHSLIVRYYAFDTLISVSLLAGLMSLFHRSSRIAQVSLILLFVNIALIRVLRAL